MSDVSDFNRELDLFADSIDDDILEITKQTVKDTYEFIVESVSPSPTMKNGDAEYSLGSYVQSHRINIGEITDYGFIWLTNTDTGSAAKAMMQLSKLNGLKPYQSVFISNNIPWAVDVEMGWAGRKGITFWPGATHGPYAVYARGQLEAVTELEKMTNYFSNITHNKMRAK